MSEETINDYLAQYPAHPEVKNVFRKEYRSPCINIYRSIQYTGEGNGNPLQYSCLQNSMDGGAWQATVHGVAKSQTRLSDFTFFLQFLLENEMATHSSVLAWRIPMDRGAWWATVYGAAELDTTKQRTYIHTYSIRNILVYRIQKSLYSKWWWWFSHSVVSDSCDPVDCSPPGSSVHGIFQARIMEWIATSFSRGSSQQVTDNKQVAMCGYPDVLHLFI